MEKYIEKCASSLPGKVRKPILESYWSTSELGNHYAIALRKRLDGARARPRAADALLFQSPLDPFQMLLLG